MKGKIIDTLRKIYDPEIPVNIYDLGLVYQLDTDNKNNVFITMTLTAPNCPIADHIVQEVHEKINEIEGTGEVNINLVFDPPWKPEMMTEEARLETGLL
ncbi:MAG: iron-sulfur cluster assembly protein [Bacteroidales bacterium]|nr:iron-sulfur cluster assembly protein [Bacteroidales bacterium]